MLYISFALSIVLLVFANRSVARRQNPVPWVFGIGIAFAVCPIGMMLFFPAVSFQAAILGALLAVLLIPERGRRLYFPLSVIATVAVYGVIGGLLAVPEQLQRAELRQQYPFESVTARLPQSKPVGAAPKDANRWENLDREIDYSGTQGSFFSRSRSLRALHEDSVSTFVNNPGFGVGRMSFGDGISQLRTTLPERPPVPQPEYHEPFVPPDAVPTESPRDWDRAKMLRLHDDGLIDFVNARGFGYVKNRDRVAGFQRHGMTKLPRADSVWTVARIELVGLVVHVEPVAYASAHLPRMEAVGTIPTRPLNEFERAGLDALRTGDDLYVRGTDDAARMLGAIRSTKVCAECHGTPPGTLLGAFSYSLRRDVK